MHCKTTPFWKAVEDIPEKIGIVQDKRKQTIRVIEAELNLILEIYDSGNFHRELEVEKYHGEGIYIIIRDHREFLSYLHREIAAR